MVVIISPSTAYGNYPRQFGGGGATSCQADTLLLILAQDFRNGHLVLRTAITPASLAGGPAQPGAFAAGETGLVHHPIKEGWK
jgi:hypothetical protein